MSEKADRFVLVVESDPKLFQAAANQLTARGYAPQGVMAVYVKSRRGSEKEGVTIYEYEYAQAFWLPQGVDGQRL
jgi:hypothetical protein